jgi:tight adherence protein C
MTPALFVGGAFAAGFLLLLSGAFPAPMPVGRALARLHEQRSPTNTEDLTALERLLGQSWSDSNLGARILVASRADLRITGRTPAQHLARRASFGLLGLLWAPCFTLLVAAGGVRLGLTFSLWACLVLAPLGFVYPGLALRAEAAERRRAFRHALGAFLDVVAVSLASGRGVDTALRDGVTAGSGWPFGEIEQALTEARLRGESPWAGLSRLSRAIDVPELAELAASAALAGNEGARVRSSLAAKARAIRVRALAEIETAAQSATERMTLPIVLLMVGFVVFLGFPAIERVVNGL